MATKNVFPTATAAYLSLVKRFPLTPIKNDKHLAAAQEVIDALLQEDLDASGEDYLDVLSDMVIAYEDRHHPMADASDVDVLRELMRSNGLSQNELAKRVGISQSTISDVLNGTRKLNKGQVIKLANFFNVDPTAFLPSGPTGEQGSWSSGIGGSGPGYGIAAASHSGI
jgi:HTH-type transcriptional regulator / antitoxin HigA